MSRMNSKQIEAIVFDMAGTLVDFGSMAPVHALQQIFARYGIDISVEEARRPMGSEKREHIARILKDGNVQRQWRSLYGKPSTLNDVARLYNDYEPIQVESIRQHLLPIDGCLPVLKDLHQRGISLGLNTGYSRRMATPILQFLKDQDVITGSSVCGDEVPMARPAPHMVFKNMMELGARRVQACIKVDDAISGIEEGRNAGMWTVAVAISGNAVGLSEPEWNNLSIQKQQQLRQHAVHKLQQAGAHYVIDSVKDLLPCVEAIEQRINEGERPC